MLMWCDGLVMWRSRVYKCDMSWFANTLDPSSVDGVSESDLSLGLNALM